MTNPRTGEDRTERWLESLDLDFLGGPTSPPQPRPDIVTQPAEHSAPQLDWADGLDAHFEGSARHRSHHGRPRVRRVHVLIMSAAAGVLGLLAFAGSCGGADDSEAPVARADTTPASAVPPTSAAAGSTSTAESECPTRIQGDTVISADRGGTSSGPEAILAFETGYYVDRSAAKARAVTTPDAALPAAEVIQSGIDSVPRGTTHCVRITPAGPDTWTVELTERRPGAAPAVYPQTITTTTRDGHVLITGITAR
ncbi:hypothetical protein [Nocardia gipuzkoensis]|uniref:hypothetical protein n=1 Tax=Nocardia gipuzkoensis TaxID=2749991 RepID=UPI00237E805A|nr:hypothetical protein [Nocardia gipuzkoensis]MDE1672641.1 hypothetical protein [Nocardia gipuzkoensis]